MSGEVALVAAITAHLYDYPDSFCECGEWIESPSTDYPKHLAAVLESYVQQRVAEALEGAAADLRRQAGERQQGATVGVIHDVAAWLDNPNNPHREAKP